MVTVPLAPRTARAIDLAIGERTEGPLFMARDDRRLHRYGAGRIVRMTARRAGIAKLVTPAHAAARVHHRSLPVSTPGSRCETCKRPPRMPIRGPQCVRPARGSLDRHATYIVAAYLAGAAR